MSIDIKKSFTIPFQNKYWKNYMFIYSVLCYVPVLVILLSIHFQSSMILIAIRPFLRLFNFLEFVPLGFIIHLAHKELNDNNIAVLNFKESFLNSFKIGANLFVITFLYSFLILFILIIFVSYFVINDYFSLTDLLSSTFLFQNEVVSTILTGLLIFFTFTLILIPYFFVAFAERFELFDAFKWNKIFKRLFTSWKEFIISVICILLVNLLTFISAIFLFIASKSGINTFLATSYVHSLGSHILPSQIVLGLWIVISGIIVISISAISFIGFMILYNMMAQVYRKV